MDKPRLFSTFMLWMLAQLYESLPEAGDLPKPKLCFFFDEAHLLFDDASEALMDQVERTARLIRSKGVGVYFVTQAPTDVPSSVLAQLGNRVQHALRAFTPDDADALRKTARTFPMTDFYDVEKTITSLGTGEALVTVLSPARRADAAGRDAAAGARFADGADRRGRSSRAGSPTSPFAGEVRRDRRSRQRLRADHRPASRPPARPPPRPRCASGVAADDRDRDEHDDARPSSGARSQRQARELAAAQKAAERERKAQEKAAARRGASPAAVDRQRDPDRRQGRDVAAGPGPLRGVFGTLFGGGKSAT